MNKAADTTTIPRGAVLPPDVRPYGCRLQTGDVMFTRGKGWLERLVRWGNEHRGTGPARTNHQLLVYDTDEVISFTVARGPNIFSFAEYWAWMEKRKDEWIILRCEPAADADKRQEIRAIMRQAMNEWSYSHAELGLQFIDCMLSKIFGKRVLAARRLGKIWKKGVVCSTGSNIILKQASMLPPFGQYWSPDDTLDYIYAHPLNWKEIVRSTGWE